MTDVNEYINISLEENGLQKIILNRPEKKNALNGDMFISLTSILRESSADPSIRVIAFSGVGDYFTSGNDSSNFLRILEPREENEGEEVDFQSQIQTAKMGIQNFVAAFIDCPKLLVAVVNGSAVGIGVTILAHFDIIFASDLATFHCPFTKLAMAPEGCSSLLFPLLTGHTKAAEILILGKKFTAQEAFTMNLVTEVVEHHKLAQCWDRIRDFCKLPPNTMLNAKSLLRKRLLPILHKVNEEECDSLAERWTSDEFLEMVTNLMMRKSKL